MFVHVPPFLQGVESHSFTSQIIKYTQIKIKSERFCLSRNAGQIATSAVHCYGSLGRVATTRPRFSTGSGVNGWNLLKYALLN